MTPADAKVNNANIYPGEKGEKYVTKDSGNRESFTSGAVCDTREGKGRFDLIPAGPLSRLAGVYERGAAKYSDNNWKKGIPMSRRLDSAFRHLNQYKGGDRSEDHLAQAAWNCFALMWYEGGEWDDMERLK